LVSWSSNTTTMRSCLPDERALTWLVLSLEKLGCAEPAGVPADVAVVEPAAVPAVTPVRDIASPAAPARARNRAVLMISLSSERLRSEMFHYERLCSGKTLAAIIVTHNGAVQA
jgi:hypothetical protein